MLANRIEDEPSVASRISYAIRHRTSNDDWLYIDSTNLDELAAARFPSARGQRQNLLNWMADQVQDDRLATVRPPEAGQLAAVIGVANGSQVGELFSKALEERFIEPTDAGGYRLTIKGWDALEQEAETAPASPLAMPVRAQPDPGPSDAIVAVCPLCGPRRHADVIASHSERDPEEGIVFETTTLTLLRCRGCRSVFVKRDVIFSEDETVEQDPETGEWKTVLTPTTVFWPAHEQRARPPWFPDLTDDAVRKLLDEVYAAMNTGLLTLAAMGVRTVLDRTFELAGADAAGTFDEKLKWLRDEGVVGARQEEILRVMTDAGSAAAHRGWKPDPEELSTILDATEGILHDVSIMPDRAAQLKKSVPPRPPRQKKKKAGPQPKAP